MVVNYNNNNNYKDNILWIMEIRHRMFSPTTRTTTRCRCQFAALIKTLLLVGLVVAELPVVSAMGKFDDHFKPLITKPIDYTRRNGKSIYLTLEINFLGFKNYFGLVLLKNFHKIEINHFKKFHFLNLNDKILINF